MIGPILLVMLLLAPLAAMAEGGAAAPVCKGSQGYADAIDGPTYSVVDKTRVPAWAYGDMEYRRAAGVLAEYNPTSLIHLTMARP